jgi:SAM-dependent methyltransferase
VTLPRHQQNRASWNHATRAHNSHKGDQGKALRNGLDVLFPDELELLGPLDGLRLLHLQCNCGQDSLCLARRGAVVTGVDISDVAIETATGLSRDSGIPGTFERADVLDWLPRAGSAGRRFDVVFASYGWMGWLGDLDAWARGVAAVLAPGGRLVTMEFHPTAFMFERDLTLAYAYGGGAHIASEGVGDYVARAGQHATDDGAFEQPAFVNPEPSHEFSWGLEDLVGALLRGGLQLETLQNYPYSNFAKLFDCMEPAPGRRFQLPDSVPQLPLMFGLVARAPRL